MDRAAKIAAMKARNHYTWLEEHLPDFFEKIGLPRESANRGLLSAHGDKGFTYRGEWDRNGIPFFHGMAILLATYSAKYGKETRETGAGWVAPDKWVIANYREGHCFVDKLPPTPLRI